MGWRRSIKDWGLKLGLVALGLIWLTLMAASWADAATPKEPAPANNDDEYNFNWLDPEKKIYVLQNRKYGKAHRFLVSAMIGPGLSNPYRSTLNIDPRIAYYPSESFGVEVFYTLTTNKDNNTFEALKQASSNTIPVVREISSQAGVLLHWVPWYAKINVFNRILYFDWYLAGGAGTLHTQVNLEQNKNLTPRYDKQDLFSFYAATGHQYHLNRQFTVRLDFSGAFYRAPIFGNSGDQVWFSNYNFVAGIGLRL